MDVLLHMAILAIVFYFVLTKDLRVPHQKALTRCVLLTVVAALVHFFLKGLRLEGLEMPDMNNLAASLSTNNEEDEEDDE